MNPSPSMPPPRLPLRWKGIESGPFTHEDLQSKLAGNEIGLLHEVLYEGKWLILRDYLEKRKILEETERRRRVEQEMREESERLTLQQGELGKTDFPSVEKSQKDLPRNAGAGHPQRSGPSGFSWIQVLGLLLCLAGCLVAAYTRMYSHGSISFVVGGRTVTWGAIPNSHYAFWVGLGTVLLGIALLILGKFNRTHKY